MGGFVVDAFGTRVAVRCADEDLDRLRGQWRRCLVDGAESAALTLTHPGGELRDSQDYALVSALTNAAIEDQAGQRLMLHACGVADPDTGRVAVLVAPSGTGKTTAAVRLGRAGLGYVSDETISIEDDLRVRRYPKPVSVVIDGAGAHGKRQHGPDELGLARPPAADLHLGAVLVLRRDRDDRDDRDHADRSPTLTPMSLIDGLIEIIPQTSALPRMTHPLLRLARAVTAAGGPRLLQYREIGDALPLVRDALATGAAGATGTDFEHHPPSPEAARRCDYTDAIADDDRVLLLQNSRTIVLDGLGALIWRHPQLSHTDLEALARREFGDHPEASRLIADADRELIAHAVMRG